MKKEVKLVRFSCPLIINLNMNLVLFNSLITNIGTKEGVQDLKETQIFLLSKALEVEDYTDLKIYNSEPFKIDTTLWIQYECPIEIHNEMVKLLNHRKELGFTSSCGKKETLRDIQIYLLRKALKMNSKKKFIK